MAIPTVAGEASAALPLRLAKGPEGVNKSQLTVSDGLARLCRLLA